MQLAIKQCYLLRLCCFFAFGALSLISMEERENRNPRDSGRPSSEGAGSENSVVKNFESAIDHFLADPNLNDQIRRAVLQIWIMELDKLLNVGKDSQSSDATKAEAAARLKKIESFMTENEGSKRKKSMKDMKDFYLSFLELAVHDLKIQLQECTLLKGSLICVEDNQLEPDKINLNKLLTRSLEKNAEAEIIELLEKGADPNCIIKSVGQDRSFPALFIAIMQRQSATVIRAFLTHGANPNFYNEDIRSTPLTLAIILQDKKIVRALTSGSNPADVSLCTNGVFPLTMATRLGSPEIVKILTRRLNISSEQQSDSSDDDDNKTESYHTASEPEDDEEIIFDTEIRSLKGREETRG